MPSLLLRHVSNQRGCLNPYPLEGLLHYCTSGPSQKCCSAAAIFFWFMSAYHAKPSMKQSPVFCSCHLAMQNFLGDHRCLLRKRR